MAVLLLNTLQSLIQRCFVLLLCRNTCVNTSFWSETAVIYDITASLRGLDSLNAASEEKMA